jgi:hypothetical protein
MPGRVSATDVSGVVFLVAGTGAVFLVAGAVILIIVPYVSIPYVEIAPREETGITTISSLVVVKKSLLNETFVVGAGKALARCYEPFPPGATLHIAFEVLSGGDRNIDFLVMDEPEWRVFEAGGSPYTYSVPSRRNATEARVTWNPPSDKQLCFVFDNTFSTATSKTVHAEITASYKEYTHATRTHTYTIHEPTIRYRTLDHPQTLGLVMLVAGATLLIISWYVSPRQKPAEAQH